jgi:predicted DNA-binding transcriptional regulator AlpA
MAETRRDQVVFEWGEQGGEKAPGGPAGPLGRAASAKMARPPRRPQHAAAALPPLPPDDELWDVRAAARFLKRSVSWVYHRAEDGTLPVRRLGGWGLRFIPGELRAWVETGSVATARQRR